MGHPFGQLMGLLFVAFGTVMGVVGHKAGRWEVQAQALERGLAQYCPTTGQFGWKGECDQ